MERRKSISTVEWYQKTVLVMVGLPARGKSYIAKKITTYHKWLGFNARFFNVGNHRRDVMKGTAQNSDFFNSDNSDAKNARENIAMEVLHELLVWLKEGGDVAVFDATNTTEQRRRAVLQKCKSFSEELNVIFIESICSDPEVIRKNMMQKATGSPDYKTVPLEQAMADLQNRIGNYEKVYETIQDVSMSYIKLINLQSTVVCNRIFGSIPQSTATFLMALNVSDRTIWLTRSGQVEGVERYNTPPPILKSSEELVAPAGSPGPRQHFVFSSLNRRLSRGNILPKNLFNSDGFDQLGKSSRSMNLSEQGALFAHKLNRFITDKVPRIQDVQIYTSTAPRAVQTSKEIHGRSQQWSALNNLDTGFLDGMDVDEIRQKYSTEFDDFARDPFHNRLPGGECFEDVVRRTEPFIIELERQTKPCLVISHLSVLRVLLGYFLEIPSDQLENIDIPQHTVIQLVPSQYGWQQSKFSLIH